MSKRIPSYCLHRGSGQAVVRIDGTDHYLGKYGTEESRAEYERLIAEWLVNARRLPPGSAADGLTVWEVILHFWRWAEQQLFGEPGWPSDPAAGRPLWPLMDRLDEHWLAADLPGLRQAVAEFLAIVGPTWDAGKADRLLAELRAAVKRVEAVDFAGRPPEALRNVLADALALGEQYVRDPAAEAARGWDALQLLRGPLPHVRRCAANAKRLATNPEDL